MLTKNQFDILVSAYEYGKKCSQREFSSDTNLSVGSVNKICKELEKEGFLLDGTITEDGLKALEPYKVKRAVIIAAGFGSRLVPITLNTPKPLVRVNGKRIIESTLDALIKADITEIYLVRGYLAEQFDQLLYKYPTIKFIENTMYNEANNISSVYMAKDYLDNAYILEADWILYNHKLIKKYQYSTNYLSIPVEKTDDWCFTVKQGIIKKVSVGGEHCYQMVGFSYWTKEDGIKLKSDIEKIYLTPGGKERYWDQVPLTYCKNNYAINIRQCKREDILEIDTFNELKQIDKTYDV